MDLIMFLFIVGTQIINAYMDGKKILAGKQVSHALNTVVRLVIGGLIYYAHWQMFGSHCHAAALVVLAGAFCWPVFDILLSLQLTRGRTWGYVGTTAITDRITKEIHVQLKLGILILAAIIYSHFSYNVYIEENTNYNTKNEIRILTPSTTDFYMPADKSPNRKRKRDFTN